MRGSPANQSTESRGYAEPWISCSFQGSVRKNQGESYSETTQYNVLNVFIDIQTSKELIQMDTDKMIQKSGKLHFHYELQNLLYFYSITI